MCLSQLPDILGDQTLDYKFSSFFTDQLTAFEVWLEFGAESKKPPEQLPIVLQVRSPFFDCGFIHRFIFTS